MAGGLLAQVLAPALAGLWTLIIAQRTTARIGLRPVVGPTHHRSARPPHSPTALDARLAEKRGLAFAPGTVRRRRRMTPGPAGLAVVVALGLVLVQAELAPVPLVALALAGRQHRRRRQRRHERAVVDELPDLIDLLRLTTLAGLPVGAALEAIADQPGGVTGAGMARAAGLVERGAPSARALHELAEEWGQPARSLVDALVDHDRYGTPLAPALDRVAIEARLRRRRQAEEEARRLPVTLLFPLVFTTLPAFALLTVIPLLAGSFSALSL